MPDKYNPGGFNPGLGERMPSMRNTDVVFRLPTSQNTTNNVNNNQQNSSWFLRVWNRFESKINK